MCGIEVVSSRWVGTLPGVNVTGAFFQGYTGSIVGRVGYLHDQDDTEARQGQEGDRGGRAQCSQGITSECRNEGIQERTALERIP